MTRAAAPAQSISVLHLLVVVALALGLTVWRSLSGDPLTNAIEDRLLDLRFKLRGERTPPAEVVIVAIDEAVIDRFGWAPPPRDRIAAGIRRILDAEPAVLALDLLFLDATDADPSLTFTLAAGRDLVLGMAVANSPGGAGAARSSDVGTALSRSAIAVVFGDPSLTGPAPRLLLPAPALLGTASLAHVNIVRSTDGIARRIPLSLWVGDRNFLPSVPLEVARRLKRVERRTVILSPGHSVMLGGQEIPTDRYGAIAIGHYGGAGVVPTVSLLDVIEGGVPAETFRGRAVLLGATAASLSDSFATPFGAEVPGVEIFASVAGNLIAGDLVMRDARTAAIDLGLAAMLAVLVFMAIRLGSRSARLSAGVAVWVIGGGALHLAFAHADLWLDATAALGTLALATSWCAYQRLRLARRLTIDLSRQRSNLSRYVSPVLVEELASERTPGFDRRTQDASVLFVDVVGYTTMAERMSPAGTAELLRELHQFFERCAADHRGVIVSFEGDGAMIVFGLPEPEPDDAARALDCGRALVDGAGAVPRPATLENPLKLRVSVNHGPVTAAVVGGARQAQVTLTGDTVNVASRLQDVAKAHGASIVASRSVLDAAMAGGKAAACAGFTTLAIEAVRGRAGRIEVCTDTRRYTG